MWIIFSFFRKVHQLLREAHKEQIEDYMNSVDFIKGFTDTRIDELKNSLNQGLEILEEESVYNDDWDALDIVLGKTFTEGTVKLRSLSEPFTVNMPWFWGKTIQV